MEDLASETSGSHCDDISIVQTSDGSASESEVCMCFEITTQFHFLFQNRILKAVPQKVILY